MDALWPGLEADSRLIAALLAAGIKRVALLDFDVHHGECSLCGRSQYKEFAPYRHACCGTPLHDLWLHMARCCLGADAVLVHKQIYYETLQQCCHYSSQGIALLAGNGTEACVKATVPESQQHRFSTPFSQGTQIFHVFRPWLGFDDPDNVLFAR